jgi:hypothetical protein
MEAVVGRQELCSEDTIEDSIGSFEDYGSTLVCAGQASGEEAGPGKCWVPEEVGLLPKNNNISELLKGHIHMGPGKDSIARGAPKRRQTDGLAN